MPHQRQLIREAAKAALVGKTAAADRVYETRVVPLKRLELPAIVIFTLEEAVAPDSRRTAPRELERTVQLVIEAVVKLEGNVDDALDSISLEIERALHADETLGGTASDSILASSELDVIEDGDRPVGVAVLTYSVTYYTYAPDAADVGGGDGGTGGDSGIADLERVDIRYSPGGAVHPDDEARDRLEGLEG